MKIDSQEDLIPVHVLIFFLLLSINENLVSLPGMIQVTKKQN